MLKQETVTQKLKQAWLITWEWSGDHAQVDNKVVAIVSSRKSQSQIREIVELFWSASQLAWFEQAAYAKNRRSLPYQAEERALFEGQVICGHNPWIEANRVHDLVVHRDEFGQERLTAKHWRPTMIDGVLHSQFVPFSIIKEHNPS